MLSRINKFIIFVLLVSLGAYVVYLNSQQITLVFPPSSRFSANAGVIYLGIFFSGMLCAGLVSLFFGVKAYWRERALKSRDRQNAEFLKGILKARAYLSTGDWRKSAELWQGLMRKDQSSVVARIELSRALETGGELREALKAIDDARAVEPHNTEILFRAAELNLSLKNKTAAIDNLALILYHEPNRRAAQMARDLSEDLGRYADALEYQAKLESLGYDEDMAKADRSRIKFKRLMAESASDSSNLDTQLKDLLRSDPNCAEALGELAKIESMRGQIDQAAQFYVRAAKASGNYKFWQDATKLWVAHGMPDRAVSAARSATREAHGQERLQAELNLIRIYLAFQMLDEAKKCLDNFRALAKSERIELSKAMEGRHLLLRALHEAIRGDNKRALDVLEHLADEKFGYDTAGSSTLVFARAGNAPSPSLSTP